MTDGLYLSKEKIGTCKYMDIEKTTINDTMFIEQLYDEYKYLMYASVKKYINDPEIIEDLLQDCIIRLIPKAPVLQHMEKPAVITYVIYTVRNTTYNYLKHKSIEEKFLTFDMDVIFDDLQTEMNNGRNVEARVIGKQEATQFRETLMQLPEREQELLVRKYYFEETNQAIAKHMGCKSDSVRMLLTRARRSMLNLLRKENKDDEDK